MQGQHSRPRSNTAMTKLGKSATVDAISDKLTAGDKTAMPRDRRPTMQPQIGKTRKDSSLLDRGGLPAYSVIDENDEYEDNKTIKNSLKVEDENVDLGPVLGNSPSPSPDTRKKKTLTEYEQFQELTKKAHRDEGNRFHKSHSKIAANVDHLNHEHGAAKVRKKQQQSNLAGRSIKQSDALEVLTEKNIQLKKRQTELQTQIKLIGTKFKRQVQLLEKERQTGGKRNPLTKKFEDEFNTLVEKNATLRIQEQELQTKVKKLIAKRSKDVSSGKQLYSTLSQNVDKPDRRELQQQQVIINLRATLDKKNKELTKLVKDVESARRFSHSSINIEELQREKRSVELQLLEVKDRVAAVNARLGVRADIHRQGQEYEQQKNNELARIISDTNRLNVENRTLLASASQNPEIKSKLEIAKRERDRLQREFDNIMKQPFFARRQDNTHMTEYEGLQKMVGEREREIAASKNEIAKCSAAKAEMDKQEKELKEQIDKLTGDMQKMQSNVDPKSLKLYDVMSKLNQEDNRRFREVMQDLGIDGQDPKWYRQAYQEQLNQLLGRDELDEGSIPALTKKRDTLREERTELNKALQQEQILLNAQVQMDKDTYEKNRNEIQILEQSINRLKGESARLTTTIQKQNDQLITLRQTSRPAGLTQADLLRFNEETTRLQKEKRNLGQNDAVSEISAMTEESALGERENLMDLRVTYAVFSADQVSMALTNGRQDIQASNFQTFVTVDFFNHDTKNSDICAGLEPNYNTVFRFKNLVDNFYMRYVENETAQVDIFLVPQVASMGAHNSGQALRLGRANLPLVKLIEQDSSLQSCDVVFTDSRGHELTVGKIFYHMSTKVSLDKALEYYKKTKKIENSKKHLYGVGEKEADRTRHEEQKVDDMSMIEIVVESCRDLQIHGQVNQLNRQDMKPFFTYDFYNFSHTSAVVQGSNPVYNDRKQFQVENTVEFLSYMKKSVMLIDFLDESVDLSQQDAKDYIGSARVPLQELLAKGQLKFPAPIKDENGNECGKVTVKLVLRSAKQASDEAMMSTAHGMLTHKRIHQDVINSIARAFAETELEDVDMFIGMLFSRDHSNSQAVPREQLQEFLLSDMRVQVNVEDLRIFMRTHELLQHQSLFTKQMLKAIFEQPFRNARLKVAEQMQYDGSRYPANPSRRLFQQASLSGFGVNETPNKPVPNPFMSVQERYGGDFDDDLARDESMQGSAAMQRTNRESPGKRNTVKMGISSKNMRTTSLETVQLDKLLKEKVYTVIQQVQNIVGNNNPKATQPIMKQVLIELLNDNGVTGCGHEVDNWIEKNSFGDIIFYRETLDSLYGQKVRTRPKRSSIEEERISRLRGQLYEYVRRNNYTLKEMFAIMDQNKDNQISVQEFCAGLRRAMSESDAISLFKAIDHDNGGSLTMDEVSIELSSINCALIMEEIRKNCSDTGTTIEKLFQSFDMDRNGQIDTSEFHKLVNAVGFSADKTEVDQLFKIADKGQRGYLVVADLKGIIAQPDQILTSKMFINRSDIFMPLNTIAKSVNSLSTSQIFDRYAEGDVLSFDGLIRLIDFFLHYELLDEEQSMLKAHIYQMTSNSDGSMDKNCFESMMMVDKNMLLKKRSQLGGEARLSLKRMKMIISVKQIKILDVLRNSFQSQYDVDRQWVNVRNFKHFLFYMCSLQSLDIDNICLELDRDDDGFIQVEDIQRELLTQN